MLSSAVAFGRQPFFGVEPSARHISPSHETAKTSAQGTVIVPIEALLKRITGACHANDQRGPVAYGADVKPN
ncbi:hypothetical protein Pmar_PMAR001119, partial [Perkinsus marinus ATCC 50983]